MNLDLREILTVAMVLFAVIDIVGTIPNYLSDFTQQGRTY